MTAEILEKQSISVRYEVPKVEVLVFKTNIRLKRDIKKVESIFNNDIRIIHWNIDTTDIDNVLRIESINLTCIDIIRTLSLGGFVCEELN